MTCNYIDQVLTPYAYFGRGVWQDDCTLEQPRLKGPENSAKLCYQNGVWEPGGTGISVEWHPVPGASFYVLQTSINSSFFGPDFKSYKISGHTPFYNFLEGDIRFGETIYWRVWAYSNSGCTSLKSEEWSFTWDCEVQDGKNGSPGGDGSNNPDINYCEAYKIQLKIDGADKMYCCDREDWFAKMAYSCKDYLGNEQVALVNTEWVVTKQVAGADKITEFTFPDFIVIESSCHASQKITIHYIATFREISTLRIFQCQTSKEVTISCETKPKDKPWLKADGTYTDLIRVVSPVYVDEAIGSRTHFMNDSIREKTTRLAAPHFLLPLHKLAVLSSPVFQVQQEKTVSDNASLHSTNGCCAPRFQAEYVYHQVLEARGAIPLGCGLRRHNNFLEMDLEEIAGDGLIADVENCKLHTEESGGYFIGRVKHGRSEDDLYIENNEIGTVIKLTAYESEPPYKYGITGDPEKDIEVVVSNPLSVRIWEDSHVLVKRLTTPHELGDTIVEWIIVKDFSSHFFYGTLNEDLLPSVEEVVIDTTGGIDGKPPPTDVLGRRTVKNPYKKFGAAGDRALVQWNENEDEWELIAVEGSSFIWYKGFLRYQVTDTSTSAFVAPQTSLNSGIDVFAALGSEVEVVNYIGGVGDEGDDVICAWNAITNTHYLVAVQAKLFQPLVGIEIDTVNNVVKGHRKKVYVMTWTQEDENSITLEETTTDCTP